MPFSIVRNDISKMNVDAIVNAANTDLQIGGGVCGAIFKAAGAAKLQAACDELTPLKTGGAAVTQGFDLPAKYVIHAAGPIYRHWSAAQSAKLLVAAYTNALFLAVEKNCKSIAFPLISSGIYGYPKEEALRVATSAIQDFLAAHDIDVYLVVFDKSAFEVSEKLLGAVASYIDEHYVDTHTDRRRPMLFDAKIQCTSAAPAHIDDVIGNLDEPFSAALMRLINAKGMGEVDVYKRANINRKLFSKIRTTRGYIPSKRTAVALAIALKLSLSETDDLLERAGYALSSSQKCDIIAEYFIVSGKYDIFEINEVLFEYDQPLLGEY